MLGADTDTVERRIGTVVAGAESLIEIGVAELELELRIDGLRAPNPTESDTSTLA